MNDDPATDASPAWYTPPDWGGRPSASPPEAWPVAPAGGDGWPAPPPVETPEAAQPVDEWPGRRLPLAPLPTSPPVGLAGALAPPAPIIRPAPAPQPQRREQAPDEGGRGWGIRLPQSSAGSSPTTARPSTVAAAASSAAPLPAMPVAHAGAALTLDSEAPPPPLMPWDARPVHRPMRRYLLFGAGLFALCGLGALALTNVGRTTHSIQLPESVGSLTLVDAPTATPTLQAFDHYERSLGATNVVTGVYGEAGQPQLLVLVVQNPMVSGGGTAAGAQAFMHGLTVGAGSVGWTLDPAKLTSNSVDGTTFECDAGPSSQNGGASLSTCAWTDPGIAGAVVDVTGQPLADVLNEAVLARAAAVH